MTDIKIKVVQKLKLDENKDLVFDLNVRKPADGIKGYYIQESNGRFLLSIYSPEHPKKVEYIKTFSTKKKAEKIGKKAFKIVKKTYGF